jgi:hypothetical protein
LLLLCDELLLSWLRGREGEAVRCTRGEAQCFRGEGAAAGAPQVRPRAATMDGLMVRPDEAAAMLSAAELLLSVSPMFKPCAPRDRSWSMQSLETLVDVAMRAEQFSLGPAQAPAAARAVSADLASAALKKKKQVRGAAALVTGRSLVLSEQLEPKQGAASKVLPLGLTTQLQVQVQQQVQQQRHPHKSREASVAAAAASVAAALEPEARSCPSVLPARLQVLFFSCGRVGVYTRDERARIITRFVAKRAKRVWWKKVRYSCRRSLADQRVRTKGRFVKTSETLHALPSVAEGNEVTEEKEDEEEDEEEDEVRDE